MNDLMKKMIFIMLSLILSTAAVEAQPNPRKMNNEEKMTKLFNAKVKMMKEQLLMSDEQTEQFIPIYKAYLNDMRKEFKDSRHHKRGNMRPDVKTADDACKVLTEDIDSKIRMLNTQKNYIPKFSKVLNAQQLMKLLKVENDMQRKIRREWKGRKKSTTQAKGC